MEVIVDLGGLMVLSFIVLLWALVIGRMLCRQAEEYEEAEYDPLDD